MRINRFLPASFICALLAMGIAGALSPAPGQQPVKALVQTASFSALAAAITTSFPLAGMTAFPPQNWCFEVENDPHYNWWSLRLDGALAPHSSEYGKRVRLIYKGVGGNPVGFASIFLGMDFQPKYNYGLTQSDATVLGNPTPAPPEPAIPQQPIQFPAATDNGCPDFDKILPIMFSGRAQYWVPLGNPLCTPAQCIQYPMGKEKEFSQYYGNTNAAWLLHWNFNGQDHAIPGAMRFLVQFCEPYKPCPDPNGTPAYGYLIVGYGGSGGAG